MGDGIGAIVQGVTSILENYRDDLQQAANRRNQLAAAAVAKMGQPQPAYTPTTEKVKPVSYNQAIGRPEPQPEQKEPQTSVSAEGIWSPTPPTSPTEPAPVRGEELAKIPGTAGSGMAGQTYAEMIAAHPGAQSDDDLARQRYLEALRRRQYGGY